MSGYIKSPVRYTGVKYKLLPQIIPLFPENIDIFIDVFGGSGTVSFNVKADNIIYNDCIPYIKDIFNTWKYMKLEDIVTYCKHYQFIDKDIFLDLRKKYNQTKDTNILFVLISHSYNGQMRFNSKLEYNSSYAHGVRYLNNDIINNVIKCKPLIDKITYINKDFRDIDYSSLTTESLVYFDPPYSIGKGVYQDGKRGYKEWSKQDDFDLFNLCDTLNDRGIRFAMSNLFSGKGLRNEKLIEWSEKYIVHHLSSNYNHGNRKISKQGDDEVLIVNYDL